MTKSERGSDGSVLARLPASQNILVILAVMAWFGGSPAAVKPTAHLLLGVQ
jgi:hypothetical protein